MWLRTGAVLALFALGGGGSYAWLRLAPRAAPAGQAPLVTLDARNVGMLAEAFDAAADRTRILALLSPT
jgi:hypothetical protein